MRDSEEVDLIGKSTKEIEEFFVKRNSKSFEEWLLTNHAVFSCISKVVGFLPKLKLYNINAITPDSDAQGEVAVKLEYLNKEFIGKASDIDIIVASAKSYINAINKIINFEKNSNMQEGVSEISISSMKGI